MNVVNLTKSRYPVQFLVLDMLDYALDVRLARVRNPDRLPSTEAILALARTVEADRRARSRLWHGEGSAL